MSTFIPGHDAAVPPSEGRGGERTALVPSLCLALLGGSSSGPSPPQTTTFLPLACSSAVMCSLQTMPPAT